MWTLIRWLQHDGRDTGTLTRKSWPKLRRIMGDKIGNLFENKLKLYWREEEPPIWSRLKSENRNSIFYSQDAGLTGLHVESSIPGWIEKLSDDEIRRAAEWALTELNGFPEWYSSLAEARPDIVAPVLNAKLDAELAEVDAVQHPHTLSAIHYGSESVRRLAVPYLKKAVQKWPEAKASENQTVTNGNLYKVLSSIISVDKEDMAIADLCEKRFCDAPNDEAAATWLNGLCAYNLGRGIAAFTTSLKEIPENMRQSKAVEWFGTIFNDRDHETIHVKIDADTDTDALVDSIKLAYEQVRRGDDIHHEGAYSPGLRDKAQEARNRVLSALIDKPGAEAHNALVQLADDPILEHMPDRLRILARQRAAKDSDTTVFSVPEFKEWENKNEKTPQNWDDLFEIMMSRLDDIEHDILHHDFTDRDTLAKIKDEREMQPLLARKILDSARGQYQVVREDEAADKKKTDIRLLAGQAGRSVIEVKIGDNWSVTEFERAIETQLVGQYLRHRDCTAGVLLITYAGRKGFENPETGENMRFDEVIQRLQHFANDLETTEQGRIRLGIVGYDLRSTSARK